MTSPSKWLRPFRRDSSNSVASGSTPQPQTRTLSPLLLAPASPTAAHDKAVFGSPIEVSTQLAHGTVLIGEDDSASVYGQVPLIVVSCGGFLKRQGISTEGIFRVGGSSKRLRELQEKFNSPPDYGANETWEGYTVHDAASLLRRYLTALPEPLVPFDMYHQFRDELLKRPHLVQYLKDKELKMMAPTEKAQIQANTKSLTREQKKQVIEERSSLLASYSDLFNKMKPVQRRTLFYILDMLQLFHSNSKVNKMSAKNLSYIFQPSIIFHPEHELSPDEYTISGLVLEFCITYSYKILAEVQQKKANAKKDAQLAQEPNPSLEQKNQEQQESDLGTELESVPERQEPESELKQEPTKVLINGVPIEKLTTSNTEATTTTADSESIQSSRLEGHVSK